MLYQIAIYLSLLKISSGVAARDSCASGSRDVCVPDQAAARRTNATQVTGDIKAENLVPRSK
jgi:hypothetical protein